MRKRSKYRPKGVIPDTMRWIKTGMTLLAATGELTTLKIKNHAAMEALRKGDGTFQDVDVVVSALNIADAMANGGEIGKDYSAEIRAGQDAVFAMAQRGSTNGGRFLFTGPELTAINLAMEVHDAQLDIATVDDVQAAIFVVKRMQSTGRTRAVQVA